MTIEKLKAEHPEVHAEIVKAAVKAERDRVQSYMVFQSVDPDGVKKGIESGDPMSDAQRSEFALAAVSGKSLKALKDKSAGETQTEEQETEKDKKDAATKEKKTAEFFDEVHEHLGLKKA